VVSSGSSSANPYLAFTYRIVGTPGVIWGKVVVVLEEEVVVELGVETVVEEEVDEEGLGAVVVEEAMVVEEVELSALVDTARLVDVLAEAVVEDEPPPPHALRKRRPATTPGTMLTTSLLIWSPLRARTTRKRSSPGPRWSLLMFSAHHPLPRM
jgi:hypothetical protein